MNNKEDTTWYFCSDCRRYYQGKEAIQECLLFQHKIRKRTPISERIIYKTQGITNIPLSLNVNNQNYDIFLNLLVFHNPRLMEYESKLDKNMLPSWEWIGSVILNFDWENLSKRLSLSVKEIKGMIMKAIRQDNYKETDTPFLIQMFVCHDSDLKLIPQNMESKWVITSMSELKTVLAGKSQAWMERIQKYTPIMKP